MVWVVLGSVFVAFCAAWILRVGDFCAASRFFFFFNHYHCFFMFQLRRGVACFGFRGHRGVGCSGLHLLFFFGAEGSNKPLLRLYVDLCAQAWCGLFWVPLLWG